MTEMTRKEALDHLRQVVKIFESAKYLRDIFEAAVSIEEDAVGKIHADLAEARASRDAAVAAFEEEKQGVAQELTRIKEDHERLINKLNETLAAAKEKHSDEIRTMQSLREAADREATAAVAGRDKTLQEVSAQVARANEAARNEMSSLTAKIEGLEKRVKELTDYRASLERELSAFLQK